MNASFATLSPEEVRIINVDYNTIVHDLLKIVRELLVSFSNVDLTYFFVVIDHPKKVLVQYWVLNVVPMTIT